MRCRLNDSRMNAVCFRLRETVTLLSQVPSRETKSEIRRNLLAWGVATPRHARTLSQQREALWEPFVQVARSMAQGPLGARPLAPAPGAAEHARLDHAATASAAQPRPDIAIGAAVAAPAPAHSPARSDGADESAAQPRPRSTSGVDHALRRELSEWLDALPLQRFTENAVCFRLRVTVAYRPVVLP